MFEQCLDLSLVFNIVVCGLCCKCCGLRIADAKDNPKGVRLLVVFTSLVL